jgi:hypothetical protein
MNNEFVWTDELTKEFINWADGKSGGTIIINLLREFKKLKQKPVLDWQVEMFYDLKDNATPIRSRNKNDKFHVGSKNLYPCFLSQEELLYSGSHRIHSVRRLSDNEVFTVNEIVKEGTILGFYTRSENNTLRVDLLDNFSIPFSDIHKTQTILFRTEDGVDITNTEQIIYSAWTINWIITGDKVKNISIDKDCQCKRFSTLEAAQEYITLNKPFLSVNDVMIWIKKWYSGCEIGEVTVAIDSLKEFAEKKTK